MLIVRHGNTFDRGDIVRRIGARTDLPLTAEGEAQAGRIATWLKATGMTPDCVLTGPLQRARRSAAIITGLLPQTPPPIEAAWLDEIDYGPDEGKAESDVVNRVGKAALAAWDTLAHPAPGWLVDRDRQIATCRAKIDELDEDTVMLVTSNGLARFIVIALGLDNTPNSLKLRTGSVGHISVVDGTYQLMNWDFRPQ